MMTIMGIQARTSGIDIKGTRVKVGKIMSAEAPRRIAKLQVTFRVPGDISERHRAQLVRAAHTCPVHYSLHPDVVIDVLFEWSDGSTSR